MRIFYRVIVLWFITTPATAVLFSNIQVNTISWSSARVEWNTDIASTGAAVQYDACPSPCSVAPNTPYTYSTEPKLHSDTNDGYLVGGLMPSTTYYFKVCVSSAGTGPTVCSSSSTFQTIPAPQNRFSLPTALPTSPTMPTLPSVISSTYTVGTTAGCTGGSDGGLKNCISTVEAITSTNNVVMLLPVNTYLGNFDLTTRSCGSNCGWIIVETSSYTALPPPGVRIDTPTYSAILPTVQGNTPGGSSGSAAVYNDANTNHWWFIGIRFTHTAGNYNSVLNMQGGSGFTVDTMIFDRCYLYSDNGVGTLMNAHGTNTIIANSYLFNVVPGSVGIALDVTGARGLTVTNNTMIAPGISMFGETANAPPLTADHTYTHNYFAFPSTPTFNLNSVVTRQLFEFKTISRLLVNGNTFANEWCGGITGGINYTMAFTARADDFGSMLGSQSGISDVTITNNSMRQIPGGIQILANENVLVSDESQGVKRMLIRNNLGYRVDGTFAATGTASQPEFFGISGSMEDLIVDHNLWWNPVGNFPLVFSFNENRMSGLHFTNNAWVFNNTGSGSPTAITFNWSTTEPNPQPDKTNPLTILNSVVTSVSTSTPNNTTNPGVNSDPTTLFTNNLMIPGVLDTSYTTNYASAATQLSTTSCNSYFSVFPTSNTILCPGTTNTAYALFDQMNFNNWRGEDFEWNVNSAYIGQATDGQQLGPNIYSLSIAQGWVFGPTPASFSAGRATALNYETRDTTMTCYFSFDGAAWVADTPGTRFRSMALPGGSSAYAMSCAGGSLPGSRSGQPANFTGVR